MGPGEQLGGYRLVRLLGAGTRSRVLLAFDGESTAAIKVFRPGATPESIDDEIAALSSASHAHVVALRDVGAARDGLPYLVLERLESTDLGALLSARRGVSTGEAVTMLAPIVAAVGALHSSGVAHGAISAARVLFRATGAPVLCGLGRASLFVPPSNGAMLSASRPVLEDRIALGRLVRTVLAAVQHGPETEPLTAWLGTLERDGYPDEFTEVLLDRVFALGQATPVRRGIPAEAEPRAVAVAPSPAVVDAVAVGESTLRLRVRGLIDGVPVAATLVDSIRGVRRPVLLAAAVGVASLVAALLIIPPTSPGEAAQVPSSGPIKPTSEQSSSQSTVSGDDPALALPDLLVLRERCIRDLSILCLENVAQSGSAAMDDDVALIRSIESGQTTGEIAEMDNVVLVERHGDAALLDYSSGPDSEPASVLLVKGEAGWRIRDYLAG